MSEFNQQPDQQADKTPQRRRGMSRRQFLTYTLGGTGGFLAAGVTAPFIPFAIDPLLKASSDSDFIKVAEEAEITSEPKEFKFEFLRQDGWHEAEVSYTAWIRRNSQGEIVALSPVCKHLGCTVNWDSEAEFPNEYFCPCHRARYDIDGDNIAVADLPLDEYEVMIDDGYVYLGKIVPNRLRG